MASSYGSGGAAGSLGADRHFQAASSSSAAAASEGASASSTARQRLWRAGVAGVLVCAAGYAAYASRGGERGGLTADLYAAGTGDHPNAGAAVGSVMAYNEYTLRGDGFAGAGYPWISEGSVVEPHRSTTLYVKHAPGRSVQRHLFVVGGPDGGEVARSLRTEPLLAADATDAIQLELAHVFTALGTHRVSVFLDGDATADATAAPLAGNGTALNGTGLASPLPWSSVAGVHSRMNATLTNRTDARAAYERELHATYVRRNVYTTSRGDRDAFLDTFVLLQSLSANDAKRYGEDCHPLSYFLSIHLEMAAGRVSDKFHDGMGFLTQHAALTNQFELALQAADPAVTIPYWDYTEEGEAVREADALEAAWATELWNDTWFGKAEGALHTVTTGRFAYQMIGTSGTNATLTSNPYGLLRAPWNVNKSPFVSRMHKVCDSSMGYSIWPRCETHYNLTFYYDTFYDWIWEAAYAPHGPVHYYIGGYTNCGDLGSELAEIAGPDSEGAVESFARMMVVLPKQMYRAFLTNSPTCSMDTPQEECTMACTRNMRRPGEVSNLIQTFTEVAEGLAGTGIPVDYRWLQKLNSTQAMHLARVFCSTPFTPGEQLEAASPVDVSFWPIHPTVERLLQYKRLVHDFLDETWTNPDPGQSWYCQEGITVEAAKLHGQQDKCEGHHATDMTLFASRVKTEQGFKRQYLTNVELLMATSPATYRMAYIYDHFNWDHCAAKGVDFPKPGWVIKAEGKSGAF